MKYNLTDIQLYQGTLYCFCQIYNVLICALTELRFCFRQYQQCCSSSCSLSLSFVLASIHIHFSVTVVSWSELVLLLTQLFLRRSSTKKVVMFSDDKNWFPISSTIIASFLAAREIWPTLLSMLGAVDQGYSCPHLRPASQIRQIYSACMKPIRSSWETSFCPLLLTQNKSLVYTLGTKDVFLWVWMMMTCLGFDVDWPIFFCHL